MRVLMCELTKWKWLNHSDTLLQTFVSGNTWYNVSCPPNKLLWLDLLIVHTWRISWISGIRICIRLLSEDKDNPKMLYKSENYLSKGQSLDVVYAILWRKNIKSVIGLILMMLDEADTILRIKLTHVRISVLWNNLRKTWKSSWYNMQANWCLQRQDNVQRRLWFSSRGKKMSGSVTFIISLDIGHHDNGNYLKQLTLKSFSYSYCCRHWFNQTVQIPVRHKILWLGCMHNVYYLLQIYSQQHWHY